MNLVSGVIRELYVEEEVAMAKVQIRGAYMRVPVTLIDTPRVGDVVLIESGVAISRIEKENTLEE